MSGPLFLLGVNQHVERERNTALRGILLQTVAHMKTRALACRGRLALVGYMNAAPDPLPLWG